MSKVEILKKAMEKAVKNGWNFPMTGIEWEAITWKPDKRNLTLRGMILSEGFAKAFWGEAQGVCFCKKVNFVPHIHPEDKKNKQGWQYHLSKMVLEKDPIKYLEKFL